MLRPVGLDLHVEVGRVASRARLAVASAASLRGVPATSLMNSNFSVTGLVGVLVGQAIELRVVVVVAVDDQARLVVLDGALELIFVVIVHGPAGAARRTMFLALLSPP